MLDFAGAVVFFLASIPLWRKHKKNVRALEWLCCVHVIGSRIDDKKRHFSYVPKIVRKYTSSILASYRLFYSNSWHFIPCICERLIANPDIKEGLAYLLTLQIFLKIRHDDSSVWGNKASNCEGLYTPTQSNGIFSSKQTKWNYKS